MICALLVDPDDSIDFPGNEAEVLGRPLAAYPLLAAKGSEHARRLYAQTSSDPVRRIAVQLGAIILDPPSSPEDGPRATDTARVLMGYRQIADDLKAEKGELELLVLLFANTGAVNTALIDAGLVVVMGIPVDAARSKEQLTAHPRLCLSLQIFSERHAFQPFGKCLFCRHFRKVSPDAFGKFASLR